MSTYDWTVETGNVLGEGGEYTPVQYPRSGDDRNVGIQYKGAASQGDDINAAVAKNNTGNVNVPRHADVPINYDSDGEPAIDAAKGLDD